MVSSIFGLLITTLSFSGLVLAYQYVEETYNKAARYPLNQNELNILQSAGLNTIDNIQSLNLEFKSLPQNQ